MAKRVAPLRNDADNTAGSFMLAACNDWHCGRRSDVGTGQRDLTYDAGYTTACVYPKPELSVSSLDLGGSPYMTC